MGFGHRIYKNFDPRATIIKRLADQVFEVTGRNPKLDIALELERIALQDDYFIKRKLYPNVDFYSGLIYQALRFPTDMFPVLFALGRMSGWLAQWQEMLLADQTGKSLEKAKEALFPNGVIYLVEMLLDEEKKIARPRQVYLGKEKRDVVMLSQR